jgi:hypothetical protein
VAAVASAEKQVLPMGTGGISGADSSCRSVQATLLVEKGIYECRS